MSDLGQYNAGFIGIVFLIASVSQFLLGNERGAYGLFIASIVIFFLQVLVSLPEWIQKGREDNEDK